jgi:hypothetical protein
MLAIVALTAVGCETSRPWQSRVLGTNDRQMAFDLAKEFLGQHYEVAESNWTAGTIQAKPQMFEGKKFGTLADVRGAGGRWRRIVYCEVDHDGLGIVARVAVLQQRETSAAGAAVAFDTGQPEHASGAKQPPIEGQEYERPVRRVWTDAGYDAGLAREILGELAAKVEQSERRETTPQGQSAKDLIEESKKYATP